ncbi:hypothetical protein SLEP1_g30862 [Rubroshorea leprosula]|uniref:Epidermal patterning factor-like protein n=1 Tax=Rubroshorea leprosula TaxID=152421 RepID=A0AAV5K7V7_9ROSI|nr:hypothetical protein SLEP1_g30862 [Rubroshorea leprosula]
MERKTLPRFIKKLPVVYLIYCFSSFFFFFFFFSGTDVFSPAATSHELDARRSWSNRAQQEIDHDQKIKDEENFVGTTFARRSLGGPGSSPPRCTSKCDKCTPCKPVHVPVPPGTPVTAEYYPEAWRCKCGNKLYMP